MNWTRKRIEARWGLPFWDLVRALHAQDLNRRQAAHALGMHNTGFEGVLKKHPALNPWGSPNVVANYVRDTGEPFRAALERMAAAGYSFNAASREIGFAGRCCNFGLRYAMRVRGIDIKFEQRKPEAVKKKPLDRGPNVSTGWPTWAHVYQMEVAV